MEVIFLLQAKLKTGELVTLFRYTRDEIAILRNKEQFFCPTCKERVIVKAGMTTIPHFSHIAETKCESDDRGEGKYHEMGKLQLFTWFKKQGLSVTLEEYIPEIRQRPDLLIRINGKKIAVEYQCATIPIQEIQSRTNGYQSLGIHPIWILGANHFHRLGKNTIKLNQFTIHFIHQFNINFSPTWYFFDPQTSHFIIANSPYLTRHNSTIVNLTIKKLSQFQFVDLFKRNLLRYDLLCHEWKRAKYRFRMRHPNKLYGRELAWYRWLYRKGMHREHLSSVIYLPVASQFVMKMELWDWQSRICLEIIDPLPIGGIFSIATCESKLPSLRKLPLVSTALNPIIEFFQLLVLHNIIEKLPNYTYKKLRDIQHYKQIETSLLGDIKIMDNICKILSAKYEHDS
jgi:competence protein CoiA